MLTYLAGQGLRATAFHLPPHSPELYLKGLDFPPETQGYNSIHPVFSGTFQLRGQQLPDKEEKWGLAAARPLPNPTNLSHSPPESNIAP